MPVLPLVVLLPLIPFVTKRWISLPHEMLHAASAIISSEYLGKNFYGTLIAVNRKS